MCGIAGELRWGDTPASREAVARMVSVLRPRGPDGEGIVDVPGGVFGHRRLAVIDPSDRSAQPMVDPELGLTLVYNGALYEYRTLRTQLEGLGYRFTSDGDTEVVLKAYHAWGPACVEHLRGMFAFAVVDRAGRTFLARDRMGIKPLYFAELRGGLRFASTIPALLAAGDVDTRLDPAAVQQFCTLHGIVAAPRTILSGVRKLVPGTSLTIEPDGTRREHVYWHLARAPDSTRPVEAWTDALEAALLAAVRRRRVADTEVGVLLSGGLDSSLIVALLATDGAREVPTFSIGFETIGDDPGDEFVYSDEVARRFATRHTRIRVTPSQTVAALPDVLTAMSEPMVSHDNVGFFLLGRTVGTSVKVVQCGQGADELLAGYHWYARLLHDSGGAQAYAAAFFDRDFAAYAQLAEPAFAGRDHVRPLVEPWFSERTVDGALGLDAAVMLPSDPIPRLDNMMMASGIEARVPFLDEQVVDVATRIPAARSVPGGKAILKAVARRYLPAPLVDRPKGYFPVPALRWLGGEVLELVRGWLTSDRARTRGLFRRAAVDALLANPQAPLTPLGGSTLWQLASLEGWLAAHGL